MTSESDLPRFTYAVSGSVSDLLQADPATFNKFGAPVRADLESMLRDYDIQDHAMLRELLGVELTFQVLSGTEDKAALQTVEKIRALEDKPDAKLVSGLQTECLLKTRAETGLLNGEAVAAPYARCYAAALDGLPWKVVGNRLKESKTRFEITTAAMIKGRAEAEIGPGLAKSHSLSNDLAWRLLYSRAGLLLYLPLKTQTIDVISKYIAAHDFKKPDIWAARDVTLDSAQHLTPVRVAIWDSGVDVALFPGQVYTDPNPGKYDPHGLAFDLLGFPAHGNLFPLSPDQQREYPGMEDILKGYSDLILSLDSPEATAVKQKAASLPASEVPSFFEAISLYSNYVHGTHVAGIAVRGNPAARIVVARITFDWKNVPTLPTEELERRAVADYMEYVNYLKKHGVRVVNMSWGGTPKDYESALEKNGVGKDAAERKVMARKLFVMDRDGLYAALKSAPEILFICAAGNDDSSAAFNEFVPSSFKLPNLLSVGAVDQAGDEASFTNYGDTVLVDANGYEVESYFPGGRKVRLSGTSMASPNAVNLAAKLLALRPELQPAQVISLIRDGATVSEDGRRHLINPKHTVELLLGKN
ncbi:MAG: S8 family serine peptidase [Terriglobales bacterium]